MTRIGRLAATAALVAAVAAGAAVSLATTPASAQVSCDGVWVVVDAAVAGGPVTTRCASGSPSTGLNALREAGHEVTLVAGQPFVCRIDRRPADDPCMRYASSDAYWSYWHAEPGGSWRYSNEGAGTRTPPPGSVDGWAFGAGDPPSAPPPSPPAPEPSPSPEPSPEPSPSPTPTASGTSRPPAGGSTSTGTDGDGTTDGTTSPPPTPTAAPGPADGGHDGLATQAPRSSDRPTSAPEGSSDRTTDAIDDTDAAAVAAPGRNTPLPALVGVLLAVAIAAGGFLARVRRQSNGQG